MQVFVAFSLLSVLWARVWLQPRLLGGSFNAIIGGLSQAFLAGVDADSLSGVIP